MKTVNYLRFCSLTLSLQYPRNSIKSDSQLLALLLLIVQILLISFPLRIYTIKGGGKRKAEGTTPLNLERFFKWAIKTRFQLEGTFQEVFDGGQGTGGQSQA